MICLFCNTPMEYSTGFFNKYSCTPCEFNVSISSDRIEYYYFTTNLYKVVIDLVKKDTCIYRIYMDDIRFLREILDVCYFALCNDLNSQIEAILLLS